MTGRDDTTASTPYADEGCTETEAPPVEVVRGELNLFLRLVRMTWVRRVALVVVAVSLMGFHFSAGLVVAAFKGVVAGWREFCDELAFHFNGRDFKRMLRVFALIWDRDCYRDPAAAVERARKRVRL